MTHYPDDVSGIDPVSLEHRLTNFEAGLFGLREEQRRGYGDITQRLDRLNGQVAANTQHRIRHERQQAIDGALKQAAARVRQRDFAIVGMVASACSGFAVLAVDIIRTLLAK